MTNFLFKKVDISPLIVFRIFFGLLMTLECWGAIVTGWVSETFVDVSTTYTFMGLEWTSFLLGNTMYFYYFIMGVLGIMIMLGFRYIFACFSFFLLWGLTYLMQKCHYNNHYYLIWLVSGIMMIVPANKYYSLDAKHLPFIKQEWTSYWTIFIFQLQIAIVYLFATVAKFYPGWLENKFLKIRLKDAANWFRKEMNWDWYANFLEKEWVQYTQVYAGIGFDLLVIPLLLFKRTRTFALVLSLLFHLTNSITLQIGIFPYFALAFGLFFYPREVVQKRFFKSKAFFGDLIPSEKKTKSQRIGFLIIATYFIIQIALPLRHWFIQDNVLWTEEGHRLAWRMMLRTKHSHSFRVYTVDTITKERKAVDLFDYGTRRQIWVVSKKPDMIWQLIQKIKADFEKQGRKDYELYAESMVSVNGGKYYPLIDKTFDLSKVDWNTFGHQEWIMPCPEEYN